jgi:hypothetical protein
MESSAYLLFPPCSSTSVARHASSPQQVALSEAALTTSFQFQQQQNWEGGSSSAYPFSFWPQQLGRQVGLTSNNLKLHYFQWCSKLRTRFMVHLREVLVRVLPALAASRRTACIIVLQAHFFG